MLRAVYSYLLLYIPGDDLFPSSLFTLFSYNKFSVAGLWGGIITSSQDRESAYFWKTVFSHRDLIISVWGNFDAEGHVILIQCTYSLAETAQLRAAIKEYEDLIRDYKEQVGQVER